MRIRVGINLGDVLERDGALYGDGVNIAARLEALADHGGICVSGTVYDQIKNRIDRASEFIGEHTVKNIDDPVRCYRIVIDGCDSPSADTQAKAYGLASIGAVSHRDRARP